MGLRRAGQLCTRGAAAWAHCSGPSWPQQPFNSQLLTQQRYLSLILARLCPGTFRTGAGGAPLLSGAAAGRAAYSAPAQSRLYVSRRFTADDAAFWGIIAANVGVALAIGSGVPQGREFGLRHMRTSVEALYDGRFYTLATCMVAHQSLVHAGFNLLPLALFRRTVPLSAPQLLSLYAAGSVATAAVHVTWHWVDAGGARFGPRYALNTPAFFGCAGGTAAVTAYKAALAPAAMAWLVVLPVPILFVLPLFCCTVVKDKDYSDGFPCKLGGVAVGVLAALATLLTRGRARPPSAGG